VAKCWWIYLVTDLLQIPVFPISYLCDTSLSEDTIRRSLNTYLFALYRARSAWEALHNVLYNCSTHLLSDSFRYHDPVCDTTWPTYHELSKERWLVGAIKWAVVVQTRCRQVEQLLCYTVTFGHIVTAGEHKRFILQYNDSKWKSCYTRSNCSKQIL